MIKVKVTMDTKLPIVKQTPGRRGIWGDYQFFINDDTFDCDYWFVLFNVPKKTIARCGKDKIYFLNTEPESVHVYNNLFVRQFENIITCQKDKYNINNIFYQQIGASWMVGDKYNEIENRYEEYYEKDYDELKNMGKIEKNKLISVIASSKDFTNGHRKRLKFVKILQDHFGCDIDIFGRGINGFSDKWDVIAPYKYHIVIENAFYENYFTEKLTDAFLGQSYPIYYGCPNLEKYYDNKSYTRIDINEPQKAIEIIEKVMEKNLYEKNFEQIIKAREMVLDKYNVFNLMAEIMETNNSGSIKQDIVLYPEVHFRKNALEKCISKVRAYFK